MDLESIESLTVDLRPTASDSRIPCACWAMEPYGSLAVAFLRFPDAKCWLARGTAAQSQIRFAVAFISARGNPGPMIYMYITA